MVQIGLAKAELLALFLESILYGIFMILYAVTMLIWFGHRGSLSNHRKIGAPVATTMAILATTHIIIDFVRIIKGFIEFPGGAYGYYNELNDPLDVAKAVVYVTQTSMGDSIMLWRLFVLYDRNLFIVIPMTILLVVNTGVGYSIPFFLSQAKPGSDIFQTANAYITTFTSGTLFINSTATIGIVYRIISHSFRIGRLRVVKASNLVPIAIIIVESGALYASSVLALLIAYLCRSNGQYPALDVITPLVGIVFCSIVLQLHFHLDSEGMRAPSSHGDTLPRDYPLSIHVTRTQNVDSDNYLEHMKPIRNTLNPLHDTTTFDTQ